MKIVFLLIFMTCVILPVDAQNELKFKAIAQKDTIALGESAKIRLSLEGIEGDIFDDSMQREKSIFEDFYKISKDDNNFRTFIEVTPISLGKSIFGPFEINLLGEKFFSNEVIIQVNKQNPAHLLIEVPSKGALGKKIDIKITCKSSSPVSIQLKDNEMFKLEKQSHSSRIMKGDFYSEIIFTVTLKKKGSFILDRKVFLDLPEHVLVEPTNFKIK